MEHRRYVTNEGIHHRDASNETHLTCPTVHNQIGFMAEAFFTPHTTKVLSSLLEAKYNGSVGRAAAWADGYAHTAEGRFSYQWHWIDSHDHPSESCALDYDQDCSKGGCVVSAIANQTRILRECVARVHRSGDVLQSSEAGNLTCSQALMWVAHFLGDVHQPLHTSGRNVGGNTYKVIFGGVSTQLHAVSALDHLFVSFFYSTSSCSPYPPPLIMHTTNLTSHQVWDGFIPYFSANVSHPFSNQHIDPFFTTLVTRIQQGAFFEAPSLWLACSDPTTPDVCALSWARESNRWTCDYVWSRVHNDTDLGTDGYATGAVPIVELQISKAAYRLGTWLNRLVAEGAAQEVMEL